MSFILDALKKSEERRQLQSGQGGGGEKVIDVGWFSARRNSAWLLCGIVVAALALAGGWWLRGASLSSPGEPADAAYEATATRFPSTQPPLPYAPVPVPPAPPRATVQAPSPERVPAPTPLSPGESATKAGASPGLRERVAHLDISLHFYAEESARRMVRIDNRIVREGQEIGDGLILEKITPDGMILASGGERLNVRRPGGQP